MCGITGLVKRAGGRVGLTEVYPLCNALRHRGPDDGGVVANLNVGLAHTRLKVIDLSEQSSQPMLRAGTYITYNGEVYNFRELRSELEKLGYEFKSTGDTEVVLNAYLAWGKRCLDRFNGMFAFAIYAGDHIFLARDRYGIKPLYYYIDDKYLIFASEAKAILRHPAVKRAVDLAALREYFTFQNIFSDHTLFEGIKILPAGCYAMFDLQANTFEKHRYWDYRFGPDSGMSFEECAQEVRRLFEQAVSRQLVSDVPVGSFLSGGMDSGSIVAVAGRELKPLLTFTGGFSQYPGYDERASADLMSRSFNTEHYAVTTHAGSLAAHISDITYHLDYPLMGPSYPDWMVNRLASRFVKVCLSGAGGDELFGGYTWRYTDLEDYLMRRQRLVPFTEHGAFFSDDVLASSEAPRQTMDMPFGMNGIFALELQQYLHGLLIMTDKLSMAHSLEVRVPFLDNDLVDFALKIPPEYKVPKYKEGDRGIGKLVLREAMKELVPEGTRTGRKRGFVPPDVYWYRGASKSYVFETVKSLLDRQQYVRPDYPMQKMMEHFRGEADNSRLLWSLMSFEHWLRRYMD